MCGDFNFKVLNASHKVFLIHGYASNRFAMHKIDRSLKNVNYITGNFGYRSMIDDLDTIGKQLYDQIKSEHPDTVSFVTHSMGALVFRSMLQYSLKDKHFPVIYRVVMIAPPNKGLHKADTYVPGKFLNTFFGPNVVHMKTDSNSYARKLPVPVHSEVGIIAGGKLKEEGYNSNIKGDNDGLLTPDQTKLGMEKDDIIVKGRHNHLLSEKRVCNLVIEFLQTGSFKSKNKLLPFKVLDELIR